jgi:hypothetical protein
MGTLPSTTEADRMKDPNYPTEQPKGPVDDALTDRNSDPGARAQDAPLKVHGDALLGSSGPQVQPGNAPRRAEEG